MDNHDIDEIGWLLISRKMTSDDDPFWGKRRTFSEWEARYDLLAGRTAWGTYVKEFRKNGKVVGTRVLAPGQFSDANSFLALAWKWSESKVGRFLAQLAKLGTIRLVTPATNSLPAVYEWPKWPVYQRLGVRANRCEAHHGPQSEAQESISHSNSWEAVKPTPGVEMTTSRKKIPEANTTHTGANVDMEGVVEGGDTLRPLATGEGDGTSEATSPYRPTRGSKLSKEAEQDEVAMKLAELCDREARKRHGRGGHCADGVDIDDALVTLIRQRLSEKNADGTEKYPPDEIQWAVLAFYNDDWEGRDGATDPRAYLFKGRTRREPCKLDRWIVAGLAMRANGGHPISRNRSAGASAGQHQPRRAYSGFGPI